VHIFTHIESSILKGLFIAHFLLLRMKEFFLLNLIINKQLGKKFKEHNCKRILNLKFWIGEKFQIKKMGTFTIKGTSWSKHWILFKDCIWYVECLPWLKIPNLIVFHTIFWLNIKIGTTYDAQFDKHMKILNQVLHFDQIYNFDLNCDHKFWTILFIKDN
jgi:hypothetical protein